MRLMLNLLILVALLPSIVEGGTSASSSSCPAATVTQPAVDLSTWSNNGAAMAAIEPAIINLLQSKTVQDLGYSMYRQAPVFVGAASGSSTTYLSGDPVQSMGNTHANYCSKLLASESTSNGFVCNPPTGADAQYLSMGDIHSYSLLEQTVYTPNVMQAAQLLIKNLVNPLPSGKFKSGATSSQTTDYAKLLADHAILGVALNSLNEMFGSRVPDGSTGLKVSSPTGKSKLAIMENEATRRFEGTDKIPFTINSGTPSAGTSVLNDPTITMLGALKHLASMKAFKMWMEYQRYRQGERIEALLAANLSKTIAANNAQAEKMQQSLGG